MTLKMPFDLDFFPELHAATASDRDSADTDLKEVRKRNEEKLKQMKDTGQKVYRNNE